MAHFGVALGICTLEFAKEVTERRYGNVDAIPSLFDRDDEIAALKGFIHDPRNRAIIVYGPQGVGKTRVVLEALSSIPEQVV